MSDYQMYLARGVAGELDEDDDGVNAEDENRDDTAKWTRERKGGLKEKDEK